MSNSSISKIFPSIASAAPELTLALANFNFDFTLYKAPAPPEYQGLGNSLSRRRKIAAEDGHEHIVARKLTRLFHKYLPNVPTLLAAYGDRASKIAHAAGSSTKAPNAFGVFADYVGLDGTSIWAAATSSQEALCLHLLACMLARIWTSPQATSIWVEIIEERQKELMKLQPDDPLHLSDIAAAGIELTREDLANWDASARSWLVIADDIMKKEQTQFLLLVDRTTLPVDLSPGVYKSVVAAWKTALTTIDKICDGVSYEVLNGAVLLGLASWHLFPDMYVLHGGHNKMIQQSDSVIPRAGILTFGLECHPAGDAETEGVRWSLPLAHLHFYGYPVEISRTMGTSSLRLTLPDFHLVVLGCFFARWGRHAHDINDAAKLVITIWQFLGACATTGPYNPIATIDHNVARFPKCESWLRLLADAADSLVCSEGLQRQARERLVERGYRRYETFLAPVSVSPEPMFDLGTLKDVIPILHEEGVIHVLRRYVRETGLNPSDLIIRYKHVRYRTPFDNDNANMRGRAALGTQGNVCLPESGQYSPSTPGSDATRAFQFSSVHPVWQPANSSMDDDLPQTAKNEKFFDHSTEIGDGQQVSFLDSIAVSRKRGIDEAHADTTKASFKRGHKRSKKRSKSSTTSWLRTPEHWYEYATALPMATADQSVRHVRWLEESQIGESREDELRAIGEDVQHFSSEDILEFGKHNFTWRSGKGHVFSEATLELDQDQFTEDMHYSFLVGHPSIGAIFCKVGADVKLQDALEIEEVKEAFEAHDIEPVNFLKHLSVLGMQKKKRNQLKPSLLVRSLRGVAAATGVYKLMPSATITTSIFTKPLHEALWLDENSPRLFLEGNRTTTSNQIDSDDDSSDASDPVNELHSPNEDHFEWLMKYTLDRPRTFACIAMFENASMNIDPEGVKEVMALSVANSIYVAMPLLCDPYVQPLDHEVKHVVGNIGRPGITFLVPPPNPMVRKEDGWEDEASHCPFDGLFEDKFKSSSLHLSFTKFWIPLGQTKEGVQDVEACFQQTPIRLHGPDGKWVADLDILGSLNSSLFQRLIDPRLRKCKHDKVRRQKPCVQLKSIDSWTSFLDRPKLPGVVRATGNWLARLAAATLNVQLGYPVLVLPASQGYYCQESVQGKNDSAETLCWICALSHFTPGSRGSYRRARSDYNSYDTNQIPFFIA